MIFTISFKQNFLKPNESCLLDRKKPNIAKLVYINFLAVSMKIAMVYPVRKFSEKRLFSVVNFRTGYSMAIFMLTAKKLIYTNLAIFGFFLSNKHDSFGFRKFCLKLIEKTKFPKTK